jgi:hypothetical protein
MEANTKYETAPGKGALFAKADRESGEITRITGNFVTPEGVMVILDECALKDDGSIVLMGYVAVGNRRHVVSGLLTPQAYDSDYKRGALVCGKRTYMLNSKTTADRNGLPYRFLWFTRNEVRVAC